MNIPIELFSIFLLIAAGTAILSFFKYNDSESILQLDVIASLISMFFFFISGYSLYIGISVHRAPSPEVFVSGGTALAFFALGLMMAFVLLHKLFAVFNTPFKSDFKNDF